MEFSKIWQNRIEPNTFVVFGYWHPLTRFLSASPHHYLILQMVIQIRDIAANAMFSQKLLDQRRMMALLIIELTLRN